MAAVRLGHIKWMLAALLVLGTVPLSTSSAQAEPGCTVSPLLVNSCRPWLGANAGGYPGVPTPIDAQIAAHESRIGRSVDVAHTYHQPGQNSLNAADLALVNRPGTLLYTSWKPAPVWSDADGSDPAVNSTIDQMAASIRAVSPKKIFLTVYHEPQNDVSGGAAGCPTDLAYVGTSGTPADYRAMWRNVRDRFDALGVDNVVWAVNFMSYSVLDCMTQEMWPGNDLVDWVMWDFYGTPTVTFDAGVSAFYNKLLSWNDADHDYASKPWGLAEWNIKSSYTQAQATRFYDDARAAVAGNTYPQLKLFMVFDNANGKNTRVGYDSGGLVDAVKQAHYTAFANDPAFSGGWSWSDGEAPTAEVTSPATGATVSGTLVVTGTVADDQALETTHLLLDGVQSGLEVTVTDGWATVSFDTMSVINGPHDLVLEATDAAGNVGTSVPVTVTVANPDVRAPSSPQHLAASLTPEAVTLTWDDASDDVAVVGYTVLRDGVALGSPPSPGFVDADVQPSTTYTYAVFATDSAGNDSALSATVSATMPRGPDHSPPGAPPSLLAHAVDAGTVHLTWEEAVDDVGVASYDVLRDGIVVAARVEVTDYVDSTVVEATSYTYTVRATDTSDNVGPPSGSSTVLTPDATPPGAVPGLAAAPSGAHAVALTWQSAVDNVGVVSYRVYRGGQEVAVVTGQTYTDSGLDDATPYQYRVAATDAAGNTGQQGSQASATTLDGTAPETPPSVSATATGGTTVQVSWSASSDNVATTGYHVYVDGSSVATVTAGTSYGVTGLASATTYRVTVDAFDSAGNQSGQSGAAQVTTRDTTAPTKPTAVAPSAVGPTQVNLTWNAASDNVAVVGYHVYRNGTLLVTLGAATTYQDQGLAPRTTYRYTLDAFDAAGNTSAQTTSASATTTADTTAPTVPIGPTATTSGSRVTLTWTATTDNVKVTGYTVFRNGVKLGTTTSLTWSDSTGVQGATYAYSVDAYDAANNHSASSPTVSVKVPDVTAPGKPGTPTLTAGTRIVTVRWTAATDNVGVTGYRIYRGATLVTTAAGTARSYVDSGLTTGTTYGYRLVAIDAAGNAGASTATVSIKAK